jgi:hypothetical protein
MKSYAEFLSGKAIICEPAGIANPAPISGAMFPFQSACVEWALKRGRAALFEGTGLGKTIQQCEWARHVEEHTGRPVLILAPLAVAHQTINEARALLGIDIPFADDDSAIGSGGVFATNYAKLERFDCSRFGGVVLDESSIIKSVDGKTRARILEAFGRTPFRLACTATPAPNDYMELGNHAEVLGIMKATEMLATFFVHDGGETAKWRLKGHAEKAFWKWLASWAICIQHPRDIGFDQAGYDLPPLKIHEHIVDCGSNPLPGDLFQFPARTLQERRVARKETIEQRVAFSAAIIKASPVGHQWLAWSGLNTEAEGIAKAAIMVNVTGSDSDEVKEKHMLDFASGDLMRLGSKVSICGFGMNFQKCHQMIFLGLSDSYEGIYQAIRRCWRFGQTKPVDVHIVISSMEGEVLKNIKRKEAEAQRMQAALVEHMADLTKRELTGAKRELIEYKPKQTLNIPSWLKT